MIGRPSGSASENFTTGALAIVTDCTVAWTSRAANSSGGVFGVMTTAGSPEGPGGPAGPELPLHATREPTTAMQTANLDGLDTMSSRSFDANSPTTTNHPHCTLSSTKPDDSPREEHTRHRHPLAVGEQG